MSVMPENPLVAVTHPDPYPYYSGLLARAPIHYDHALGLWVAAGAEAVCAALTSPDMRVRPPDEPVPAHLLETPVADVFCHLVRMRDDGGRAALKQAIAGAAGSLDAGQAERQSASWAERLGAPPGLDGAAGWLSTYIMRLPIYVVASLLGVPIPEVPQVAIWLHDFVACLAPAATPELITPGAHAAAELRACMRWLQSSGQPPPALAIPAHLPGAAKGASGSQADPVIANAIGLLMQAYEATAGLIGNTLLALAARPALTARLQREPALLQPLLHEVLRCDPPVQNTRRYLAQDALVAGQLIPGGALVLVVLAAANRDPAANPDPERFDLLRADRQSFTFGAGAHACPGQRLAVAIAGVGVRHVLSLGLDLQGLAAAVRYRPSLNTRVPIFT